MWAVSFNFVVLSFSGGVHADAPPTPTFPRRLSVRVPSSAQILVAIFSFIQNHLAPLMDHFFSWNREMLWQVKPAYVYV